MEVIRKISVFSSASLNDAESIILFEGDNLIAKDEDIYKFVDLSKKIDRTGDHYLIDKSNFSANNIIFLASDSVVLGYVILAKNLIDSIETESTTHNVKTKFKPTTVKLFIECTGEGKEVIVNLYHKLISTNTNKFKDILCESTNIPDEVPTNKYGTVMSPNPLVLNGWCKHDDKLWKLQANTERITSFDFTGWNISFMFYKGDPSIYTWKDNMYSIQSLTRKTPLGTTYPYTLPIGEENTIQHVFEKGNNIDWVYGDFLKSGDKIYLWKTEEEYCDADGIIIDHFSRSNKLYTLDTLTELRNLILPYKNQKVTGKYGDWFVFDGKTYVNSKFYKEFNEDDVVIPLNNRALLCLTDRKIYCSNGNTLDSLDTFRRHSKYIVDYNGSEIILVDGADLIKTKKITETIRVDKEILNFDSKTSTQTISVTTVSPDISWTVETSNEATESSPLLSVSLTTESPSVVENSENSEISIENQIQGTIIGSIGSLIYYSYDKDKLNYL